MIGFLASGLVVAAFFMRHMIPLRVLALCSNVAFLAYGLRFGLLPVWTLHVVLLPMNLYRLTQAMMSRPPHCDKQWLLRPLHLRRLAAAGRRR
jgi:ABC-type glycerol-3-phosphate transport system permease component